MNSVIQYLWPLLILSTLGGIFTMIYSYKISKWMYKEEQMEHAIGLYGMWTGTIVTGMALLKEVDPQGQNKRSGVFGPRQRRGRNNWRAVDDDTGDTNLGMGG